MKNLLVIVTLFCLNGASYSQTSERDLTIYDCSKFGNIDTGVQCSQMLDDLRLFNKLTRGDTGEGSDSHLDQFRRYVIFFEDSYTDSALIAIVENNYCPIISCYAFTALVNNRDSLVTDQVILDLAIPFAKESKSYVMLDWGCGESKIETFDYIASSISAYFWFGYLPGLKRIDRKHLEALLEIRKAYYSGYDSYNVKRPWEEYLNSYLN